MTALVTCTGCAASFKLATFGSDSWRAPTNELQDFLEGHRPCKEKCGDQPAFSLRYEGDPPPSR